MHELPGALSQAVMNCAVGAGARNHDDRHKSEKSLHLQSFSQLSPLEAAAKIFNCLHNTLLEIDSWLPT